MITGYVKILETHMPKYARPTKETAAKRKAKATSAEPVVGTGKKLTPRSRVRPLARAIATESPRKRAKAPASAVKETTYASKESYAPAEAKKWFLDICKDLALDGDKRAYVEDRHGDLVVALDPIKRNLTGPVLDVSIQLFKNEFSRFCTLVRIGACFRLTRRGGIPHVYARRHTSYRDPLDHVVERWLEGYVERKVGRLAEAVEKLGDRDARRDSDMARLDRDVEEVKAREETTRKAIARVAAGHYPPFKNGLPTAPTDEPSNE
jgi:hypothetical protein